MKKYSMNDLIDLNVEYSTKEEIEDEALIKQYSELVSKGEIKKLPKDVYYFQKGEEITFYREVEIPSDVIEAKVECSKAKSLKSIAGALNFFAMIVALGLGFAVAGIVVLIILFVTGGIKSR